MVRKRVQEASSVDQAALQLVRDPRFLYRAGEKIGELGIVGEEPNRLALFLAGVTRTTASPVSAIVKGATGTGKSTLIKGSIQLFPYTCVIDRSGLSGKALAHGEGSLANKIMFIDEYEGAKAAVLSIRLAQSEGRIKHEFTTMRGSNRGTQVVERRGTPVVLTTTTQAKVYADDETRFLSLWTDESQEQTKAILIATAQGRRVNDTDLPMWHMATSLISSRPGDFDDPPAWLRSVAEQLPLRNVRARRDWPRFLSFCQAIALCRAGWQSDLQVNLVFSDYCIAYHILEPIFASTLQGVRPQEAELFKVVARMNRRLNRPVTVKEISSAMEWKESLVYKHMPGAVNKGLLEYEPGTRETNLKRVRAIADESARFLPSPRKVMKINPEIGKEIEYVDPFTGEVVVIPNGQ